MKTTPGMIHLFFISVCAHGDPTSNVRDVLPAPPHFEDGVSLVEINLGSVTHLHLTFLGSALEDFERRQIVDLLQAYKDCLAWS